MANKIDTNFGTVGYNISFNKDVSITWRNYIDSNIDLFIKSLNRKYQDSLVLKKDDYKNIDWMC